MSLIGRPFSHSFANGSAGWTRVAWDQGLLDAAVADGSLALTWTAAAQAIAIPYYLWATNGLTAPAMDGVNKCSRWEFADVRGSVVHVRALGKGMGNSVAIMADDRTLYLYDYGRGQAPKAILPGSTTLNLSRPLTLAVTTHEDLVHVSVEQDNACHHTHTARSPPTSAAPVISYVGRGNPGKTAATPKLRAVKAHDVTNVVNFVVVSDAATAGRWPLVMQYMVAQAAAGQLGQTVVTPVMLPPPATPGAQFEALRALRLQEDYFFPYATNVVLVLLATGIGVDLVDAAGAIESLREAATTWKNQGFKVWLLAPPPVDDQPGPVNDALYDYGQALRTTTFAHQVLDLFALFSDPKVTPKVYKPGFYDSVARARTPTADAHIATAVLGYAPQVGAPVAAPGMGNVQTNAVNITTMSGGSWSIDVDPITEELVFARDGTTACRLSNILEALS